MTKTRKTILLLSTLCFIATAALVLTGVLLPIESFVYAAIQRGINPVNTLLAKMITHLSAPITIVILCLILIIIPYTRRKIALPVSACAACAAGVNWGLKQVFHRERPNILRLVAETGYSFPSGHSATSAAMGTIFVLLLSHYLVGQPKRRILTALCVLMPFLIGVSRIYLGVHYTGDVLAGWFIGIAVGILVYWVWDKYRLKKHN